MSELRRDLITGRWIVVASAKGKSAEQFRSEIPYEKTPPDCPFCEGNESLTPREIMAIRQDKTRPNEPGWKIRVIPNQHPVLKIENPLLKHSSGLYDYISGFGAHEIVIDSPSHHRTGKDFSDEELHQIVVVLQSRLEDLYRDHRLKSVTIVKNEGPDAGALISHPHHQLIATPIIPQSLKDHLKGSEAYYKVKERCIYCDIIHEERENGERVFFENDRFLAFCPYASRFPFEIWIVPKNHDANFHSAKHDAWFLAQTMRHTLWRLALALGNPQFNYVIYTAPNPASRRGSWLTLNEDFHWHMEVIPVLTKSQSFDRSSGLYINPTSPEEAAKFLREIPVLI